MRTFWALMAMLVVAAAAWGVWEQTRGGRGAPRVEPLVEPEIRTSRSVSEPASPPHAVVEPTAEPARSSAPEPVVPTAAPPEPSRSEPSPADAASATSEPAPAASPAPLETVKAAPQPPAESPSLPASVSAPVGEPSPVPDAASAAAPTATAPVEPAPDAPSTPSAAPASPAAADSPPAAAPAPTASAEPPAHGVPAKPAPDKKDDTAPPAPSFGTSATPADVQTKDDGSLLIDKRFVVKGKGTKEEPYKVTWDLLVSAQEDFQPKQGRKDLPQRVMMLDGKHVEIAGNIAFPMMVQQPRELLAMLNPWDGCCIGIPPTPYDAVEVALRQTVTGDARFTTFGTVAGVLKVKPHMVGNWLVGLYVMEDAALTPKSYGGFAP